MRIVAPSRNRAWLAKIATLMTAMALVVAPACGPLCAAQACTQVPGPTEMGLNCHSHGVANGGAVYLDAIRSCGAPELQVANLRAANERGLIPTDRASASAILNLVLSSPSADDSGPIGAGVESPPHFCFTISSVVLRV